MKFTTEVDIPSSSWGISHTDSLMALGSCFAENIGRRLRAGRFKTDLNPFGVLYNPESLAMALKRLLEPTPFVYADLFRNEGVYHSYAHHSRFSAINKEDCLQGINERLHASAEQLKSEVSRLLITFGTSYVYRLRSTNEVVANCHKMRDDLFIRERLSVESIVSQWKPILQQLLNQQPTLKILFTVSPIRHWKDGAHANQLSKSILLLAIDELMQHFPQHTAYFPAYEIVLDELRDYRFYAADMIHPSETAIEYLWMRFAKAYFPEDTLQTLKQIEEVEKALKHRPFNPESEGYKQFLMQTLLKMEHLNNKSTYIYHLSELDEIRKKINSQ